MKLSDVLEEMSRHGGIKSTTVRQGDYEYAYLVKWKPVTRAVLSYASLREDVPLALIRYIEARFDLDLEGGDGAPGTE